MPKPQVQPAPDAEARPRSHLFYLSSLRRPLVDRAEGIYFWTKDGRRFIDGSSGPMVANIGHSNRNVLDAMKRQMDKTTFAYRLHFENEPAEELARELARRLPEGMDRIFFVSGGSEATESCIKLARQWAVATGQPKRWKVIARFPSYHGGTLGSLAVTGDDALAETFKPMMRAMPTVPAPTAWRDRDNLSMEQRGIRYADMLEEKIQTEGPENVLAFIMEPVGGAATAALVAPDSYYPRIRDICDRYGILLIHDEVMSGAGRTGKFLGGDHWNCKPDLVALSKGLGSGYAPLGALAAPMRLVEPLLAAGGFQHGHTYAGNPLACAAGLAVLGEMDRLDLIANAAAMGDVLIGELRELQKRFPFIADVRGKGLLLGAEMVADPETLTPIAPSKKATQRLLDLAYERGLIIYGRKVKGGVDGDNFMVAPPMIITREQIGEMIAIIGDSLAALATELDLPAET
ncbi:aspartate aminotransferase family protein [Mesorhizobium sp. M4A.F.Ca.ET.020.02.1.1]|uniref:aminotransferase family protein n=3 Tax=Mesorhizobium TaxID=68287 RepID=UPI000FD5ACD7|nr:MULTISPECIES: aspartate aminotransferase family protein [unclassified Mesorhizobium]RVD36683.1 aspartate aminotransferase family protein [Mesorhizobium sp. M4A.F.Ca.ET.020.02.1.1]RWC19368.1 MAG: aspartate aminotransferase family protein [Mesorhizobium sp.]RWD36068.1 MAG: aspartate aminotransferase family protein [Mesorhizobium sp.]TIW25025.1 MAG: aminotransferase class III-fold pyridoxal phosphate-dependent enzyme [Mesorhizobium sp.]TJW69576.1 MAG: aminotransferase class III-fold pyridoxal 